MDSQSNAFARYKLLHKALNGTKRMPSALLEACGSQGGLARLNLPSERITPMALNTLKSKADEVIEEGGWRKLDEMRKSYLMAGTKGGQKASSTRSKSVSLKCKVNGLEQALDTERRYRIRLQVAYEALLSRMRSIAKTDPDLAHFINRQVAGFSFKRLGMVFNEESETDA